MNATHRRSSSESARPVRVLSGGGLLGHGQEYRKNPLGLLTRFNRECGDIGKMHFFGVQALVVNSPDLVSEVLVDKAARFRKSRVVCTAFHALLGEGLFTSHGELWRRQRKIMAPLFQPAPIEDHVGIMANCSARAASGWRDGEVVDIAQEMTRITMSIAGKTLFDMDTFDDAQDLGHALTVVLKWSARAAASASVGAQAEIASLLDRVVLNLPGGWRRHAARVAQRFERPIVWPGGRGRELNAAIAVLNDRVARLIRDRRGRPTDRPDLLSRLLDGHGSQAESVMSDSQVRDEILTLFVAGHETTATALSWAMYYLARDPALLERVEAEVRPFATRALTTRDLAQLPLTQKVFKESLRIFPPVPAIERQVAAPIDVGGYRLRHGTHVLIFPWALHHRIDIWPNPERFNPERFSADAERAREHLAYIPFGAGPRVCIGNHFALLEGPIVLATLLGMAHFDLAADREVRPDPSTATMRPLGAIPMRVRLRTRGVNRESAGDRRIQAADRPEAQA